MSVPYAVIIRYRWKMIRYRCERCPSASSSDNTAGLRTNKIYLRATVHTRLLSRLRTGGLSSRMEASTWWAGTLGRAPAHGVTRLCRRAGPNRSVNHSELIKLHSLSQGTFTLRYFGSSTEFCLGRGIYVRIVSPFIWLPVRRSTAKQKGERCLSRLSPFCLLPFCSLHAFAGELFPPQMHLAIDSAPCRNTLQVCRHFCDTLSTGASTPRTAVPGSSASGNSRLRRFLRERGRIDQFSVPLFPLALSTTTLMPIPTWTRLWRCTYGPDPESRYSRPHLSAGTAAPLRPPLLSCWESR